MSFSPGLEAHTCNLSSWNAGGSYQAWDQLGHIHRFRAAKTIWLTLFQKQTACLLIFPISVSLLGKWKLSSVQGYDPWAMGERSGLSSPHMCCGESLKRNKRDRHIGQKSAWETGFPESTLVNRHTAVLIPGSPKSTAKRNCAISGTQRGSFCVHPTRLVCIIKHPREHSTIDLLRHQHDETALLISSPEQMICYFSPEPPEENRITNI